MGGFGRVWAEEVLLAWITTIIYQEHVSHFNHWFSWKALRAFFIAEETEI